jgi:hypothetical protein
MNMSEAEKHDDAAAEDGMTILAIPDEMVQQVLDFVANLQSSDDDVKGHMLSGALSGSYGTVYATTETTHTGITTFATGASGTDLKWSDTDSVTFPG